MIEVFCVKCKKKTEQRDAQRVTLKNGRPASQGKCAECGTKTNQILPKAQAQA